MILILSSPSGAGKTTLTRMMLQDKALDLTLSISVTTRARRSSEVNGIHYNFIDRQSYDRMNTGGDLLEAAEVHGNGYGTPRKPVDEILSQGRDMLFDIDWQGAQQLAQRAPGDIVRVFLLPPSIDELRRRLAARGTDSPQVIDARMARARDEISHWDGYDYVLVNDDMDACFAHLCEILAAERMRKARQTRLWPLTRQLLSRGG